MPAVNTLSGFGAGPGPDPMPNGAEQMTMRQQPNPLQVSLHQPVSEEGLNKKALKPEVPKKNKHLEEVYRLRQQLSDVQDDNDHLLHSIGLITQDFDEFGQEVISKTKELEQKDTELATVRDKVQALSAQLDQEKQNQAQVEAKLREMEAELATTREKVLLLSAQLDTEKQTQTRVEEKLQEQETLTQVHISRMQQQIESLAVVTEQMGVKENGDMSRVQAEVIRLTSLVAARDEEMRNKEAVNGESEQRLKDQLQDQDAQLEDLKKKEATAAEFEKRLATQLDEQKVRLEEETRLRETAEAALAAQQQQASTGLEMADLRRLCNYYQENSQRLSKQIKLLSTTKMPKDAESTKE